MPNSLKPAALEQSDSNNKKSTSNLSTNKTNCEANNSFAEFYWRILYIPTFVYSFKYSITIF